MPKFIKTLPTEADEENPTQIEIFPQRLLNLNTAQQLLDKLNTIGGINRIVIYGPSLPKDDPDDLLQGKFWVREKKYLNIKGERIELTVQIGRIWIEIYDTIAIEKIRDAAESALPFPFEMHGGRYIRTQKTVTDFIRKGGDVDKNTLGMFDPEAMNPSKRKKRSCSGEPPENERVG